MSRAAPGGRARHDLLCPEGLPYFLTVKETAKLLRTTTQALYQRIYRDQIPGVCHVGPRNILIETERLLAWMRANGSRASSPTKEEVG